MFDLDIHAGGDSFLNTTLCDCLRALSLCIPSIQE